MMNREDYIAQVELMLDCLPCLQNQKDFALKGGTAINFFIQNLPRLSVDIDLTFVGNDPRNAATKKIEEGLIKIGQLASQRNKLYKVRHMKNRQGGLHKLLISNGAADVKIEPNFILRGALLPIEKMDVKKSIEDKFKYSVKNIPVLNKSELYAGKICAALSRQHPRDFFDIKCLLENGGITDSIRQTFVVYLVCSPRPIHELLKPNPIEIKKIYETEFANMTEAPVTLNELIEAREELVKTITTGLTISERQFILSIKSGEPDYSLLPFKNLPEFPALKWKLINIQKIDKKKQTEQLKKLKAILTP